MKRGGSNAKPPGIRKLEGQTKPYLMRENIVDFPRPPAPPKCPEWIKSATAIAEWNRLVPLFWNSHVLTDGDLTMLAHMCDMHGVIVDARKESQRVNASERAQLRAMYSEFGLTPASRLKAGTGAGAAKPENRFAQHGKTNTA